MVKVLNPVLKSDKACLNLDRVLPKKGNQDSTEPGDLNTASDEDTDHLLAGC